MDPGTFFALFIGACVFIVLARTAIMNLLELLLYLIGLVFMLAVSVVAWACFIAFVWWYIPKDPESRSLETSMFFESYLLLGKTLYEHNLSWRRDLSLYRAAVRNGETPLPRFRFTWRRYLRALVEN